MGRWQQRQSAWRRQQTTSTLWSTKIKEKKSKFQNQQRFQKNFDQSWITKELKPFRQIISGIFI